MRTIANTLSILMIAVEALTVPPAHADDSDAAALRSLREQVSALQRRIDALSPDGTHSKVVPPSAAEDTSGDILYKGISIALGGFIAAEYLYRQRDQGNDISTNFNAIPYANSVIGHTSETRFTARQTRLSALVQGSPSRTTALSFYSEFDFQGGAQTANSNQSNSYNPRVRHLYGALDLDEAGIHVLAGQTWSLLTMNSNGITPRNEVTPPTIDGQYLPGFSWARQPQLRVTKSFGSKFWLATSFENPQTTFYTGANPFPASVHLSYNAQAGQGFDSANTLSLNHIPDVVNKISYEIQAGERTLHVEAFGIYRDFYERLDFHNRNVSGGGGGAGILLPMVPRLLDFEVSAIAGKGIGRYGSAQLPDATFTANGAIRPIHEVQMLAGMTLHASTMLDLFLFAGEERESREPYTLVTGSGAVQYGYGNPNYSNAGCMSESASGSCIGNTRLIAQGTAGFWYKPYVGSFGVVRCGLQYSHTERKSFNGIGGAPIGNQNTLLASLRYYPF